MGEVDQDVTILPLSHVVRSVSSINITKVTGNILHRSLFRTHSIYLVCYVSDYTCLCALDVQASVGQLGEAGRGLKEVVLGHEAVGGRDQPGGAHQGGGALDCGARLEVEHSHEGDSRT